MDLTYSVPTGRYGIRENLDENDTSFGTQGAVVCVILLVKQEDGNLFCGHMDCGYSGQPANRAIVIQKAKDLVATVLPNDKENPNWWMSGQKDGDPTNGWMREGINNYFTNPPIEDSERTDAAFKYENNATNVLFGNDFNDGNAVDTGAFSVEP